MEFTTIVGRRVGTLPIHRATSLESKGRRLWTALLYPYSYRCELPVGQQVQHLFIRLFNVISIFSDRAVRGLSIHLFRSIRIAWKLAAGVWRLILAGALASGAHCACA